MLGHLLHQQHIQKVSVHHLETTTTSFNDFNVTVGTEGMIQAHSVKNSLPVTLAVAA